MRGIFLFLVGLALSGCVQGSGGGGGGGFYYYTGADASGSGQDASQGTTTSGLTFGQMQGAWDILFSNWAAASGTATFAGNKADLEIIAADEGQYVYGWGYENCYAAKHRWTIHVELVTDALALCTLTNKGTLTGGCGGQTGADTSVNFSFKRDALGTSDFGSAAGSWHLEWPVTKSGSTVQCSFALADKATQGCGNAEFQFNATLVGSILNGKLDSNGSFSAQRK